MGGAKWELGVYGTNIFRPLKFAMNLKLLLKNKVFI